MGGTNANYTWELDQNVGVHYTQAHIIHGKIW